MNERRDSEARWSRSHGNENREFDEQSFTRHREASINGVPIMTTERQIFGPWPEGDTSGLPRR